MDNIDNLEITGLVVTYNRKELLLKNLDACFRQKYAFSKIVIIDNNSTDGTQEFIYQNLSENNKQKIDYVKLDDNYGGAGGFYEGLKYCYKNNYKYIFMMDDDGRPYNDLTLLNMVNFVRKNNFIDKPFFINSLVMIDDNNLSFGIIDNAKYINEIKNIKSEYVLNSANPFNGTLISRETIEKMGLPRGDYFIRADEMEYLFRAQSNNIPVITVVSSLYFHPTPYKFKKNGKRQMHNIEAPWKMYYSMRNSTINSIKYFDKGRQKALIHYYKTIIKVILFGKKDRIKTIKALHIAKIHGLKNQTGVYYLPNNKIINKG